MTEVSEEMRQEIDSITEPKEGRDWPLCTTYFLDGKHCHRKIRKHIRVICCRCAFQYESKVCWRCWILILRHRVLHEFTPQCGPIHSLGEVKWR
jgi:hypothetical protein